MAKQNASVIWSDINYEILTTDEYVEEDNAIYTQESKEINPGDEKYLAIEFNLTKFRNDENLNKANNNMCFLLPENTTLEIGKETAHDPERCFWYVGSVGTCKAIYSACETVVDSSGNFQYYHINKEKLPQIGHEISLNDTVYLLVQIRNTGSNPGSISAMYN